MKRIFIISALILIWSSLNAQYSYFVVDSFSSETARKDLSVLITRNGYEEPVTAFEMKPVSDNSGLEFNSITLNAGAIGKCGYSFDNGDYMTHSAIDYEFPIIDRTTEDIIKVEFDALWETQQGSGESGRAVIFLISDYPEGGPGPEAFKNLNGHPFGRPAYNIRILNGSYGAFMCYGGGTDPEGIFEIYQDKYWLPGFSSLAGGGTIGQGDNYPTNAFIETAEGTPTTSTTQWKHYTWILDYERQSLYWRNSGEGPENDELLLFMEIPEDGDLKQINDAHGSFAVSTPPNYNWFEQINALRFYWRGVNNSAIANVTISKTGEPVTTYVQFAKSSVRVKESDGKVDLILLIANQEEDTETHARVELVKGESSLVDGFTDAVISFPADGSSQKPLSLKLSGDDDIENDTLVFKIKEVEGGYLPTTGLNDSVMLVIRDSQPSALNEDLFSDLKLYPIPANDLLYFKGLENYNGEFKYIITTLTGAQVMKGILSASSMIELYNLSDGIYFITLYNKNLKTTMKFSIIK